MKLISTIFLSASFSFSAMAQIQITNGGFELWGNTVPSGDTYTEPTNWYSNQSGSSIAALGAETCFKDATVMHSGLYSVRLETISGPLSTVINGSVTTGVVNAPSFTKSDGYIGTIKYTTPASTSDDRRMSFTGRPDSLVGWYQYVSGGAGEQAKIRAILHTNDYYDPETPTTYHPDPTANKIADVTFLGSTSSVSSWTRFAVPFTYVSASTPAYIMINATPSANQLTTVTGSKVWFDDLQVVYNPPTNLTATSITSNSAVLNWTESAAGSAGSEYVISTTPGAPSGSGTVTTALTYTATGLTSATTYYASVRDTGVSSAFSDWVTISFTTLGTTGISTLANDNFTISAYPNPVNDVLTISIAGAGSKAGKVQLMDISGRVISTTVADAATVNISMTGLPSGMYMARYIDSEHTQTIKINKQ